MRIITGMRFSAVINPARRTVIQVATPSARFQVARYLSLSSLEAYTKDLQTVLQKAANSIVRVYAIPSHRDYLRFVCYGTLVLDANGESLVFADSMAISNILSRRFETIVVGPIKQLTSDGSLNPISTVFPILKLHESGISMLFAPSIPLMRREISWANLLPFKDYSDKASESLTLVADDATTSRCLWSFATESSDKVAAREVAVTGGNYVHFEGGSSTNSGDSVRLEPPVTGFPVVTVSSHALAGVVGANVNEERCCFSKASAIRQACEKASKLRYTLDKNPRSGVRNKYLFDYIHSFFYEQSLEDAGDYLERYVACINATNCAIRKLARDSDGRIAPIEELYHETQSSELYRKKVQRMPHSMIGSFRLNHDAVSGLCSFFYFKVSQRKAAENTMKKEIGSHSARPVDDTAPVNEIIRQIHQTTILKKRMNTVKLDDDVSDRIRAEARHANIPELVRKEILSSLPLYGFRGVMTNFRTAKFLPPDDLDYLVLALDDELLTDTNLCDLVLRCLKLPAGTSGNRARKGASVLCWDETENRFVKSVATDEKLRSFLQIVYSDLLIFKSTKL